MTFSSGLTYADVCGLRLLSSTSKVKRQSQKQFSKYVSDLMSRYWILLTPLMVKHFESALATKSYSSNALKSKGDAGRYIRDLDQVKGFSFEGQMALANTIYTSLLATFQITQAGATMDPNRMYLNLSREWGVSVERLRMTHEFLLAIHQQEGSKNLVIELIRLTLPRLAQALKQQKLFQAYGAKIGTVLAVSTAGVLAVHHYLGFLDPFQFINPLHLATTLENFLILAGGGLSSFSAFYFKNSIADRSLALSLTMGRWTFGSLAEKQMSNGTLTWDGTSPDPNEPTGAFDRAALRALVPKRFPNLRIDTINEFGAEFLPYQIDVMSRIIEIETEAAEIELRAAQTKNDLVHDAHATKEPLAAKQIRRIGETIMEIRRQLMGVTHRVSDLVDDVDLLLAKVNEYADFIHESLREGSESAIDAPPEIRAELEQRAQALVATQESLMRIAEAATNAGERLIQRRSDLETVVVMMSNQSANFSAQKTGVAVKELEKK
jgi:hypothetical protein